MKKNAFKRAKTIAEVTLISKQLKEAGEDVNEINQLAFMRKKELMAAVNKVNNLDKVLPKASALPKNKVTHIRFKKSSGNIKQPEIVINEDYSIEF